MIDREILNDFMIECGEHLAHLDQDLVELEQNPLGKQLRGQNCYAGATIMGDGKVALILAVLGIGQRSGLVLESRQPARTQTEWKEQPGGEQERFLLFRAGLFERLVIPLSLVARLEEFPQARIERAGDTLSGAVMGGGCAASGVRAGQVADREGAHRQDQEQQRPPQE
jgi:hypothetical protein